MTAGIIEIVLGILFIILSGSLTSFFRVTVRMRHPFRQIKDSPKDKFAIVGVGIFLIFLGLIFIFFPEMF